MAGPEREGRGQQALMLWLLGALLAIPLGLDLYLPVPEDNPLTAENVALGGLTQS